MAWFFLALIDRWILGIPGASTLLSVKVAVPAFLTLALLYHHAAGNPHPFFRRGIQLVPAEEGAKLDEFAADHHLVPELTDDRIIGRPAQKRVGLLRRNVYELTSAPGRLLVNIDIGNRGRSPITVHELEIEGDKEDETVLVALFEDRKVHLPTPALDAVEEIEQPASKMAQMIPDLRPLQGLRKKLKAVGDGVWEFLGIGDRPEAYFVEENAQRRRLEPGERITEGFEIPLDSPLTEDPSAGSLSRGELYEYTITLRSTQYWAADRISVSIVRQNEKLVWWTSRFPMAQWFRRWTWYGAQGG